MSLQSFQAVNPEDGQAFGAEYPENGHDEVDGAIARAATAKDSFAQLSLAKRAELLESIAAHIEKVRPQLVELAHLETGLPEIRINGEISRTTVQLQLFAAMVRKGTHLNAIIDLADPDYKPVARPDMRKVNLPIGVVAVFGASNFPFAYSVMGGDSASALAAGCPVIVKAHPSHPGTSELTFKAVQAALSAQGLSEDIFTMVQGRSPEITHWIALAGEVAAIGFTGSALVGKLLVDLSHSRSIPIPVFAEMGSLNPIFVTGAAMGERAVAIAETLFDSATMGSGQFCTKPGLIFVAGDSTQFIDVMRTKMASVIAQPLLNKGISERYNNAISELSKISSVEIIVGELPHIGFMVQPTLFIVDYPTYKANPELSQEHFGPTTVIVKCKDSDFDSIIAESEGNLTATLHLGSNEQRLGLVNKLVRVAGRLILNGAPTGVSVTPAQNHGGPWPSSSTHTTSVGLDAVYRFLRPVSFQGFSDELLPPALRRSNPEKIERMTNGVRGLN
ncbi:MAG TPA: aldehyde dehydrogenase (NADP(+)) [Candidatus Nanopelagicaceae bacterium]